MKILTDIAFDRRRSLDDPRIEDKNPPVVGNDIPAMCTLLIEKGIHNRSSSNGPFRSINLFLVICIPSRYYEHAGPLIHPSPCGNSIETQQYFTN